MAEEIFAVIKFDGNRNFNTQYILTTCGTIEELTECYTSLAQMNRKNIANLDPVEIHGDLTFILNDVRYDALELAKKHARERGAA